MCNFSEGVWADGFAVGYAEGYVKGYEEGLILGEVESVLALMETCSISLDQALEWLETPDYHRRAVADLVAAMS